MAFVKGVNFGFVTIAPSVDPGGIGLTCDNYAWAVKDTTPIGAIKIVEIGWWCNNATEEADTEVGLYSHDSGNDRPLNLLGSAVFAKGTTAGWKSAIVDIEITEETIYWMAAQLDNTATTTQLDYQNVIGERASTANFGQTTLPSPWTWSGFDDYPRAVYAVWEAVAVGTNMKINIADVFKDIESLKINISDAWKDVIKVQQNIGDVWKDVFG